MGKPKEQPESKGKFQDTLDALNKKYGIGTVSILDSRTTGEYDVISSGSLGFDYITLGIGGFAKGKMYELMGWEGCLTGDTHILFRTVSKDGKQNHKGGSLLTLYEKFNNLPITTKFKKKRKDLTDCYFTIPSINEEGYIVHSKIQKVVYSGLQPIYELKTVMGYSIKATANHKFYTGGKWTELSSLSIGDDVYIHNRTTSRKGRKEQIRYKEVSVKYHPKWFKKLIEGKYEFYRSRRSRAVVEADLNNMSYLEYIKFLNTASREEIDKLNFIPDGYEVHHKNEIVKDDSLENLIVLTYIEHGQYHANKNQNNLRFVAIPDSIVSIDYIGEENTYDIICEEPYRNFVANGIVVHNSGKSTCCGHAAAECQKNGGTVLYIDSEHAIDKKYFQALGVDTTKMLISQPSTGEEGFNVAIDMINSGKLDLLIIDSDSSLIPKKVIDGEVGESAIGLKSRLNSSVYPKLKNALVDNKVCVIIVSQYREKIGIMYGNPTTTQGGHALKYYADCRIEISKSIAKEGEVAIGNITKVKATKNKMSPPYRLSTFNVIYGVGIDRLDEIMTLLNDYDVAKKWGTKITVDEVKYDLADFKTLILDNPEFYEELKEKIINKIRNTDDVQQPEEETIKENSI